MSTRLWGQIGYFIGLAILSSSVHVYGDWRVGGVGVAILILLLFAPLLSLASIGIALVDVHRKALPRWAAILIVAANGAFFVWFARFLIPAVLSV